MPTNVPTTATKQPYCNPSKYSAECIAAVAASAGFGRDRATLERAVAVALAESSGKTAEVHANANGSRDVGLMQINSVHGYSDAEMKVPSRNMAAAWKISNGATNWKPWVTFNSKAYLLYMPTAAAGVATLVKKGYTFGTQWNFSDEPNPDNFKDNPLIPDALEEQLNTLGSIAQFPAKVLGWISNRDNILRVIKVSMGVGIVIVGLTVVARPVFKPVQDTAIRVVSKGVVK